MNPQLLIAHLADNPWLVASAVAAALIAFTLHEFAHALAATILGDTTAKEERRLSLNPFSHLDIFGFVMLLVSGFGWTKPVPVNPYALKTRFGGMLLIPLAGPAMNTILAIASGIAIRMLSGRPDVPVQLLEFLSLFLILNLILAFFNLIPIPPLDGSRVFLSFFPERYEEWKVHYERMGPFLLVLVLLADAFIGFSFLGKALEWLANFVRVFGS